jgi:hypothetical protein
MCNSLRIDISDIGQYINVCVKKEVLSTGKEK